MAIRACRSQIRSTRRFQVRTRTEQFMSGRRGPLGGASHIRPLFAIRHNRDLTDYFELSASEVGKTVRCLFQ
jgi:hypothetical protein